MAFNSDIPSNMHTPYLLSSPRSRRPVNNDRPWHNEASLRRHRYISPPPPFSPEPLSPQQSETQAVESAISILPSPDIPEQSLRVRLWDEHENRLCHWCAEFDTVVPPGLDTDDFIECLNSVLDDLIEPCSELTQLTDGAPLSQEERIERCRQFSNSLPTFSPGPRFNRDTGCNADDLEDWFGREEGSPELAAAHFSDGIRSPTPSEIQEREFRRQIRDQRAEARRSNAQFRIPAASGSATRAAGTKRGAPEDLPTGTGGRKRTRQRTHQDRSRRSPSGTPQGSSTQRPRLTIPLEEAQGSYPHGILIDAPPVTPTQPVSPDEDLSPLPRHATPPAAPRPRSLSQFPAAPAYGHAFMVTDAFRWRRDPVWGSSLTFPEARHLTYMGRIVQLPWLPRRWAPASTDIQQSTQTA